MRAQLSNMLEISIIQRAYSIACRKVFKRFTRIPEHKHQLVSAGAPFRWMVRRGAADKLPSAPIKSDGDLMSRH